AGYGQLARDNLPLNTLTALQDPEATWGDVALGLGSDLLTARSLRQAQRESEAMRDLSAQLRGSADPGSFRDRMACWLTGHPVDVASGRVLTDHVDLELPGPLPFRLERCYHSASTY